jgi:hypothetical protein
MTPRKLVLAVLGLVAVGGCSCETQPLDLTSALECADCTLDDTGRAVLDFGVVEVGATAERTVQLRNAGAAPLQVAVPAMASLFGATPQRFELPAGGLQTVTFTYAPAAEAEDVADLRVAGGAGQAVGLHLRGKGTVVRVECEPEQLSFGTVVVDSSRTLPVTCKNVNLDLPAEIDLTVEGAEEISVASSAMHTLPPGTSVELPFTFAPKDAGQRSSRLVVRDRQGGLMDTVGLVGRGITSGLRIDPGPGKDGCYDVGWVPPGGSVSLPLAALDDGNLPVHVLALRLEPADAPFRVEPAAPFTVEAAPLDGPPGQVPLLVTFEPPGPGAFTAQLHVDSDDHENGTMNLCLKGYGGGPILQCTPATLAFGLTDPATPRSLPVFCTNVGTTVPGADADLAVTAVQIGAPFSADPAGPMAHRYAPGDSFRVDVVFAPYAEGEVEGELQLETTGGPARIRVTGEGKNFAPCKYALRPEEGLDFGVLNRDRSLQLQQNLVNEGSTDCLLTDVALAGTLPKYFAVGEGFDAARIVAPGATVKMPVTFLGGVPGNYDATLGFVVNGAGPVAVPLHAFVMDLCFDISVQEADFDTVEPGCSSPERWIEISSACREALTVTQIDIPALENDDFKLLEAPPLPLHVAGGAVTEVRVAYQPLGEGPDVGYLRVFTDELPGPVIGLLHGTGGPVDVQTDEFKGIGRSSADILWVIDNSGSMSEEQEGIARNAAPFINVALENHVDFRMAVTSTDLDPGGLDGRFYPLDLSHPRILSSRRDPDDLTRDWTYLINLGTNGSGDEKGLKAARMALSSPLIDSLDMPDTPEKFDGNLGFLRRDANLAIVIVSDERDHSYDVAPSPTYWQDYVDFFRNIKGERRSNSMLRVHTITGGDDGCATAEAGYGYNEVARATGGVIQSICASDWSATLQAIAEQAFTFERCFTLHGLPGPAAGVTSEDPETWLDVELNDRPYPKLSPAGNVRWNYYAETNEICFDAYYAPRSSEVLDVSYTVACGAPR